MKNSKKIIILFFALFISIGGIGCMSIKKGSARNRTLDYLNSKYDDVFTFSDNVGGTFDSDKREFLFTSEKFPNKSIWAAYYDDGTFVDNYVNIKYEEQVESLYSSILAKIFPGQDFYIEKEMNTSRTCVDNSSNELTFAEFIKQPKACLQVVAYIDISNCTFDKEEVVRKLENEFVSTGICVGFCYLYFFDGFPKNIKTSMDVRDIAMHDELYTYEFEGEMENHEGFSLKKWVK